MQCRCAPRGDIELMACVRYWAGARAIAGTHDQIIDEPTLELVLREVRLRHGHDLARLLERSLVLVDGERTSADAVRSVQADTLIEILPPYAGGAG